jgi:lipopolysaccharide export system protein LptC
MAAYDNTYSRVVAWLKIILPLLALAILSTLFLVARTIDPAQNLPFADVDIEELTREPRIGRPDFSGVTKDGAAITLSADSVLPDPAQPGRIVGNRVAAGIDLPTGERIDIVATGAVIDTSAKTAGLHGDVTLTSSAGFTLNAKTLNVALETSRIWSDDSIEVDAPQGRITAGRFEMIGDGNSSAPYQLVFKGRVTLVYEPENSKE